MRVTTVKLRLNDHGSTVTRHYDGISQPRVDDMWVAVVFTEAAVVTWGLDEPSDVNTLVRYYVDQGVDTCLIRIFQGV